MKKLFLAIFVFCFPIFVHASSIRYDIEHFYVDAKILENGDMEVKELIVLDGNFNGYIRDITFKNNKLRYHTPIDYNQDAIYNASDIKNVSIKAKHVSSFVSFDTMNESFDDLTLVTSGNATNKSYVSNYISNGYSYEMHYKSDGGKVAFFLTYTLSDVVVLHEDVGEIYWTFIGDGFDDPLKDVQIHVSLPKEDGNIRVWAHGDLIGEIDPVDSKMAQATISKNPRNSNVDIRMTFSSSLLDATLVSKKTRETALQSIIDVEQERANIANRERQIAKQVVNFLTGSSIFLIICLIIWWIYVYFKYDKEHKSDFDLEYNREFIDDYNVETVEYLMKENIGGNAFSASILNLVYKKNIRLETISNDSLKIKQYEFILVNRDSLSATEEILVDFLFERVGRDGKFSTLDLKKYASSTKTYTSFQSSYTKWLNSARKDAISENFYEKKFIPLCSSFIFLFLGISLVSYSYFHNTNLIFPWIYAFFSVFFVFYCAFIRKKTKKGVEHYVRWKAFKKFLEDFGTFDVKELPEIVLWERYLVYATVFGIANKVQKAMNVKISEMNIDRVNSPYYPSWIDYSIASSISRSVNDSFAANRTAYSRAYSREVSSSRFSSGGGGGGGFSSGGGFGGGGGGGRGF